MRLHEIFPSVQGEGPVIGVPVVFVRFYGCNQNPRCPFCDTVQESYFDMPVEEVANSLEANYAHYKIACLTGGEPLLQKMDCEKLAFALHLRGWKVILETNGIELFPEDVRHFDIVVMSPKDWDIISVVPEIEDKSFVYYKFVVRDAKQYLELRKKLLEFPNIAIRTYIQPSYNEMPYKKLLGLWEEYPVTGVKITTQFHKLLRIK